MQEGFSDPPSVSSISRLLRGNGKPGDDGKKDYTINGILGGGKSKFHFVFNLLNFILEEIPHAQNYDLRDSPINFVRQVNVASRPIIIFSLDRYPLVAREKQNNHETARKPRKVPIGQSKG